MIWVPRACKSHCRHAEYFCTPKKESTVRDELAFIRIFCPFSLSFAQHYHILLVHLVPLGGCEQHLTGRRTLLPKVLLCLHIQSEPSDDKRRVVNVATGTMFAVSTLQMIQTETMKYKWHLSLCSGTGLLQKSFMTWTS